MKQLYAFVKYNLIYEIEIIILDLYEIKLNFYRNYFIHKQLLRSNIFVKKEINYIEQEIKNFIGNINKFFCKISALINKKLICSKNFKLKDSLNSLDALADFEIYLNKNYDLFINEVFYDFVPSKYSDYKSFIFYFISKKELLNILFFQDLTIDKLTVYCGNYNENRFIIKPVNLVSNKKNKFIISNCKFLLLLVFTIILLYKFLEIFYNYIDKYNIERKEEIKSINEDINHNVNLANSILSDVDIENMKSKINFIKNNYKNDYKILEMLKIIAQSINYDVVLTKISLKNNEIVINGSGGSVLSVSELVKNLQDKINNLQLYSLKIWEAKSKKQKGIIFFAIKLRD